MTKNEQEHWAANLRAYRMSEAEDSSDRFVELVDQADGGGLFEAKTLLSTLTTQPEDVGQGEAVISMLWGFPPSIRVQAILEELPRLERENEHSWSNSIIESAIRSCNSELIQSLNESAIEIRMTLQSVLSRISESARSRRAADIALPILKAISQVK